ncbi:variable large family protein (plasmid) [Borreliella lanei]|uniref:variable large family protein n=1 Tax=Borreliella lanei TaxID=373540 RepID=UPI003AF1246D
MIEVAGEAAGEKGDALKDVADGGNGAANKDAGKLFATTGAGVVDADVKKAAAAVSAVSGKQILKAIVDAAKDAGGQNGATAEEAKNPIAAAIGAADDDAANGFNDGAMQKNDKIAAAIVLRGLAKDGKFAAGEAAKGGTGSGKIGESTAAGANNNKADGESVKGIAKGIKGIVDAAGEAAGEKGNALKDVADGGNGDKDAGKLFATGGVAAADADVKKAAAAVSAVSGKQILKAIVDAAGEAAGEAKNPIAAAIGADADDANQGFDDNDMQKNDKIAAAIVLRGLAKGGKFAAAGANDDANVKSAVAAVSAVSGKQILKAIVDAAKDAGEQNGVAAGEAKNPIAAAIGANDDNANDGFDQGDMKKRNDRIAAAIVLRGLAKDGKFAAGADDANVKSAVEKVSGWLSKDDRSCW